MKNKGAKPKCKRKGSSGAFGCDLTEYLEVSGQDVPLVLRSCADFIETHGVVDGIYRLSGVTSNIQKLRQEFGSDQCPDLTRELYLQDIHCVGSLCKLYFRELPNPLLTYQLYKKFTEAVSCSAEGEQLSRIQNVIQELPPSHYRTLEYLSKHLTHIASYSDLTNMHIRNLALVWAPNLLRSKEIEDAGCNGDAAFLEVRIQQLVIEFILNHVDHIFNKNTTSPLKHREECRVMTKSMTLPSGSRPMKLVSLEEAQARSLAATHPARKERRENSLPEIVPVTGTLFHTVIDLPDNKRKLSTKSKKWKSIFNLGRSGADSKSKLSRNGSVFVRGQKELNEKATIRPAKSMDSLCSLPAEGEDDKVSRFKRSVATGGFFIPVLKSRTSGTGSSYDLSKQESEWDTEEMVGAIGGFGSGQDKANPKTSQPKQPPEQMKVFRVGEELEYEQTSPKIRKMFYASSDGPAKSNFPGSLFPVEASPRHQRKALNISEPFSVSVPLRVSAVISINSTPCRAPSKERHPLSSLEELPLLEPDIPAKSAAPETCSSAGLKEGASSADTGQEANLPGPKRHCPKASEKEKLKDETTITSKEGLSGTAPLSAGKQEATTGSMAERNLSVDQAFLSISDLQTIIGLQSDGSDMDTVKTNQVETLRDEPEEPLCNEQDDVSITLIDPLWPDIQQELKIIESEEELPVLSASTSEFNQVQTPSIQHVDLSGSVKPNSSSNGFKQNPASPELNNVDTIPNSSVLDTVQEEKEANKNQNHDSKSSSQPKLENILTNPQSQALKDDACDLPLPQETKLCTKQEGLCSDMREIWLCSDLPKEEKTLGFLKPVPVRKDRGGSGLTKAKTPNLNNQNESSLQVIPDILALRREGDLQRRRSGRKSSESLENDDELGVDSMPTFELEESWEDHQWVTSPLHSPKLRYCQETEIQEIQPKRRGTTGELYKRPEFIRSLSLDSKDTRMSKWTLKRAGINRADGVLYARTKTDNLFIQNSANDCEQSCHGQKMFNLPELPVLGKQNDFCAKKEDIDKRLNDEPVLDLSLMKNSLKLPALPLNSIDSLLTHQDSNIRSPVSRQEDSVHRSNTISEDAAGKPKTRPSSLTLDAAIPTGDFFTFEKTATDRSKDIEDQQIQQINTASGMSPLGRPNHINQWKDDSRKSQSHLQNQETDLDCMSVTHTPSGRRNSAPVSVSAIRASFMIKLCQAKAVPVIPPKVQYTQIPQPLHSVNADSEVPPLEKKEIIGQSVCNSIATPKQTLTPSKGHADPTKSPKLEKKALEEKENSDPTSLDSSHHSGFNSSAENSRIVAQDAPVICRKRTSDGEATGDTPFSFKIERPSFRSRPGRPQSLILFSPPFPIMDHPLPADARILLSPIKSPTQTASQESACENQRTPDGVILRNKLTIPKNGQRLETSTSCFYQPQRRSVILDSRSGRQIE
ncbi:rho GTPase-activating protein 31 isoform X2 [Ascaphus truei]|uniref:rho GTPase-activating protein 31 isoform X2 n=1 Tax=Ascaphus truei TaxID=8439 RepID=UPI003F5AD263